MRLKEIKPGMVIHCKNNREYEQLQTEAIRIGYGNLPLQFTDKHLFYFDVDGKIRWSFVSDNYKFIEFSDLVIPDLMAEEVLQVINDICNTYSNCSYDCKKECPFCNGYCKEWMAKHPKETVEICAQWKYDHEKKEPEIETVDICRIIEILPDGRKRCVHEEGIEADPELPYGGEQLAVEQILKHYCMEHDGEYIAVHEVVSRLKGVK